MHIDDFIFGSLHICQTIQRELKNYYIPTPAHKKTVRCLSFQTPNRQYYFLLIPAIDNTNATITAIDPVYNNQNLTESLCNFVHQRTLVHTNKKE